MTPTEATNKPQLRGIAVLIKHPAGEFVGPLQLPLVVVQSDQWVERRGLCDSIATINVGTLHISHSLGTMEY